MDSLEILEAARQKITNPWDWCKGRLRDGSKVCAIGALINVCEFVGSDKHAVKESYTFLENSIRPSILLYNDDPKTSHACVLAMFDAAIELAELNK